VTIEDDHDQPIDLSIVIPAFNAAETLDQQLEALLTQEWSGRWEVLVANNGSTDGTTQVVERLARLDPRVRLIDASASSGASYARNCGIAAARASSIAFCDADDVVAEGWVAAIGSALREHPFVTGPQEYERLNPPWLWGLYGTLPAHQLQTFEGIFPFGPTANLGVRRSALDGVGGFDVSIDRYEDIDLCLRLWLAKVPLVFVPDAVVHYRYRQDLRSIWTQSIAYGAAAPAIARRLAAHRRPTPSRWRGLRRLLWLMRNAPRVRERRYRARWVVVAGTSIGRVKGSIRARWLVF
jgi:glycosyltransferase involved in cell wall biosynthesis